MKLEFRLKRLRFSDGTAVELPPQGIVTLIGPNNSGKTAALRDITRHLSQPGPSHVIVEIEVDKQGQDAEIDDWLGAHAFRHPVPSTEEPHFRRPFSNVVNAANARSWWASGPPFHDLASMLFYFAGAENRLGIAASSASYDPVLDTPAHPIQVLYERPELEQELSDTCEEAFGTPLTLNRHAGATLHLHVGRPLSAGGSPPSREHLEELKQLPLIQDQGDGVRSFIGIMLAIIASRYPLILIDEPEAFLHPPQARLLGRKLATHLPGGTQVVIATHSADVIGGMLDARVADVTLVRLERRGEINPVAVLPANQVKVVWDDPLLRYSRVLEGPFFHGVIACEADGDCRLYAAVLDNLAAAPRRDTHFVPAGGKARLPMVARALAAVRVPTRVIADLDLLRDIDLIRDLVLALGAAWDDSLDRDWRVIESAVRSLARQPKIQEVHENLQRVLHDVDPTMDLTPGLAKALREATRIEDGWSAVKRGVNAIPRGQATEAALRLLRVLDSRGLFLVPVGELEGWFPTVPQHGPAWVSEVIRRGLHQQEAAPIRPFVEKVVQSFGESHSETEPTNQRESSAPDQHGPEIPA